MVAALADQERFVGLAEFDAPIRLAASGPDDPDGPRLHVPRDIDGPEIDHVFSDG